MITLSTFELEQAETLRRPLLDGQCYPAAEIHAAAAADNSSSAPQMAKIRKDTVLEKYHFWCAYGPEDHSSNLPTADKREQGERRRLTEHGESIKRGCQAHFSVTVRAKQPDQVELRICRRKGLLIKEGQQCHGAECASAGRHHTQASPVKGVQSNRGSPALGRHQLQRNPLA